MSEIADLPLDELAAVASAFQALTLAVADLTPDQQLRVTRLSAAIVLAHIQDGQNAAASIGAFLSASATETSE